MLLGTSMYPGARDSHDPRMPPPSVPERTKHPYPKTKTAKREAPMKRPTPTRMWRLVLVEGGMVVEGEAPPLEPTGAPSDPAYATCSKSGMAKNADAAKGTAARKWEGIYRFIAMVCSL